MDYYDLGSYTRKVTTATPDAGSSRSICLARKLASRVTARRRTTPSARARSASRAVSAVPTPRPCHASATVTVSDGQGGTDTASQPVQVLIDVSGYFE